MVLKNYSIMNIESLRKICTSLPAVTEDIKWGNDLAFSIGDKMFCVASLESPFTCSFKVRDDEFEELSNQNGFMPAPYIWQELNGYWLRILRS